MDQDDRPQRPLLPFPQLQDPTMWLLLVGCSISVFCWVKAVSPHLPFGNPVFIILYGPFCLAFIAALVWYAALYGSPGPGPWRAVDIWIGRTLAVLFCSAAIILAIQFFQIVAPEDLCSTRPHWEFLLTGVPLTRAHHCMSGTAHLNEQAPFYMEPRLIHPWAIVVMTTAAVFFTVKAWASWKRNIIAIDRFPGNCSSAPIGGLLTNVEIQSAIRLFQNAGVTDHAAIDTLLAGLPVQAKARLPYPGTPNHRLSQVVHSLNRNSERFEEQALLYTVLATARTTMVFKSTDQAKLEQLIAKCSVACSSPPPNN